MGGSAEAFNDVTHAYRMLTDPSYKHEQEKNSSFDLTLKIQFHISFNDAFFGKTFTLNFNRLTLDDEGNVLPEDPIPVISLPLAIPSGFCSLGQGEIYIQGKGLQHQDRVGDLIVTVMVNRHPKFSIMGMDVLSQEKIPLIVLLKGGEIDIETMYGIRSLTVPPGTRPGDTLCIPGCGVLQSGNHVVMTDVVYPNKTELKSSAWKGLKIIWGENDA